MNPTHAKIAHMLASGEYAAPEPFDNLQSGIRFAADLSLLPGFSEPGAALLRMWVVDANDLLAHGIPHEATDHATAFALFAMDHDGGHGLDVEEGVRQLWIAADGATRGRYDDKAKELRAWMERKP